MIGTQLFADSTELAASSKIFALLRTAAGNNITSTDEGGGVQALDVHVANAINVEVAGVYNVTTNPIPDSVGLIAHVRGAALDGTDQTFRSTGGGATADAVVAADISGLDVNSFGMLFNGTTWDRALGTAGASNVHLASQAAGTAFSTRQALTTPSQAQVEVGTLAVELAPTPLAGRVKILVQNQGNKPVYIGFANTVTITGATTGLIVAPNGYFEEWLDEATDIWAISSSAGQNLIVTQYAVSVAA